MYKASNAVIGTALDLTSGAGELGLVVNNATASFASGALSVSFGSDTFTLHAHTTETINVAHSRGETFNFTAGFGDDTIYGFRAAGNGSDLISMHASMFDGLSSSNTAAQNVALLTSEHAMVQSGSNVTITDTSGDVLTLVGTSLSTLSEYASSVFKFA
jgi:hypothetical protein